MESAIITITTTRGRLGAAHIEGRPKNKKPRPVPIPADLVELLKAHKAAQMRAALANGWRWTDTGYVFVDPATGEPLKADIIRHRWGRIKKAAKVDCTIHGLRHTALTILALDGVPENVRMQLGGHATEAMARHYARHATLEDVRKALG